MAESPKLCGNCVHWYKEPLDANNLGAQRNGQCQARPPVASMFLNPQNMQIMRAAGYPILQANFHACDLDYEERPAAELVDLTPVQEIPGRGHRIESRPPRK